MTHTPLHIRLLHLSTAAGIALIAAFEAHGYASVLCWAVFALLLRIIWIEVREARE